MTEDEFVEKYFDAIAGHVAAGYLCKDVDYGAKLRDMDRTREKAKEAIRKVFREIAAEEELKNGTLPRIGVKR